MSEQWTTMSSSLLYWTINVPCKRVQRLDAIQIAIRIAIKINFAPCKRGIKSVHCWLHRWVSLFFCTIMPSAHGPIFCRKEPRGKVGVKVRFFLGLSQRTRPIFYRKQLREKIGPIFSREQKSVQTDRFFYRSYCEWAGEVQLLDDVTPNFFRTEVSAHGPIFCRKQLREKIGAILYRSKSQHTRTDFHSDFLSTRKNQSVYAGHKQWSHPITVSSRRMLQISIRFWTDCVCLL